MKKNIYNFALEKHIKYAKYKLQYYEFKHKSGTRLIWVKNKDKDRFFAIEFVTLPQDQSGTPHILEHSVLHGSKKYPIFSADPFAVLLRRKQLSEINAYTFPDKTVYIFSAINNEDFIATLDFYLDSVFNPSLLEKEEIFMQEGWRVDKRAGQFVYNGVVLNEMLASHAAYDRRLFEGLYSFVLRENTAYLHSSGGNPNYIIDLSYKKFVEFYNKFYNPKNAMIYLYGDIDYARVFKKIDEYLNVKKRRGKLYKASVPYPKRNQTKTSYISGDPGKDSALAVAFPAFKIQNIKENVAAEIIFNSLHHLSSSPLRHTFEESDLVQDFGFYYETYAPLTFAVVYFKHVSKANFAKLKNKLFESLKSIKQSGLDKERISFLLDKLEFSIEKMIYNSSLGESIFDEMSKIWRHAPAYILFEMPNIIRDLRYKLKHEPQYFDNIFNKLFINNNKTQIFKLIAKPDHNEYKRFHKKQEQLNYASKSKKEKFEKQILKFKKFKEHHDDLSIIRPTNLSKLSKQNNLKKALSELTIANKDSHTLIFDKLNSKVTKSVLLFNVTHLSFKELQRAALILSTLDRFNSKLESRQDIDNSISQYLPKFAKSFLVKNVDKGQVFLKFDLEYLHKNQARTAQIINTYVNDLVIDKKTLQDNLKKIYANLKSSLRNWRDLYNISSVRAASAFSKESAILDAVQGIALMEFLSDEINNLNVDEYISVYNKMFKGGIDYYLLSSKNESLLPISYDKANAQNKLRQSVSLPDDLNNEIIFVDGLGANINNLAFSYNRDDYFNLKLLALFLNYNYLWDKLRVHGGAYGAYLILQDSSAASFTSFNDPNIESSYKYFLKSLEEAFEGASSEDLDGAKARTLLYFDQVRSRWNLPNVLLDLVLEGRKLNYLDEKRNEILRINKEELHKFAASLLYNLKTKSKKLTFSDKTLLDEFPKGFNEKQIKLI